MKNKNKICILILTGIYIFFISIFNVKAQVLNYGMGESQSQTDQGYIFHNFNAGTGVFKGAGEGQIIYQFLVTGKRNINTIAIQTTDGNTEEPNTCQFASTTGYNDSSTQQVLYSVVCNVDLSGNWRALSIRIWGYAWENTYINWGRIVQFSNFENQQDYTQVLSNVDANLNSISSAVWSIKNNSDAIKQYIESMITSNNQINNNVSDIKDKMNEDISSSDKEAPDQTQYNNAKQQEDNIIQNISNVSPNDITFSQDLQATNKIWDTTTRFLQTHAKVMGLVISILSIGIIKLIMNR